MKKLILITLGLFLFSCNPNNDENIEELQNFETSNKSLTLNPGVNTNPINNHEDLSRKLELYSYVMGRVLLNHPTSRALIINSISNNILDLNAILTNDFTVRYDFLNELSYLTFHEFGFKTGFPPYGATTHPKATNRKDLTLLEYQIAANIIETEILNSNYNDCLEMYTARPLSFDSGTGFTDINGNYYEIVYTTPHSLSDTEFPYGYSLFDDGIIGDDGDNLLFDDNLLLTLSTNVIVIRPVRNTTCLYNDINVVDFTTFYN
jgi:hypothetical protein